MLKKKTFICYMSRSFTDLYRKSYVTSTFDNDEHWFVYIFFIKLTDFFANFQNVYQIANNQAH